jgi:hypothetical protein
MALGALSLLACAVPLDRVIVVNNTVLSFGSVSHFGIVAIVKVTWLPSPRYTRLVAEFPSIEHVHILGGTTGMGPS